VRPIIPLLVCKWWSIDYSGQTFPYVPAHVTKPLEEIVVFSVSLPEKCMFAVPSNLQLVAVPLFELFANSEVYGSIIASVPALISRFHINIC
jgi:cleavage and polyadenylation specificity factor subunit 5